MNPLTMTFDKFAAGDYDEGNRNLYIVWRGKQALYVGISRDNIWNRWFTGGRGHMYYAQKYSGTLTGGRWMGLSPIGRAIAENQPASMRWKIELRHYDDPRCAEKHLISTLSPKYNGCF